MADRYERCPECGFDGVVQEEADIGVGTLYGPAHCELCGWHSKTPEEVAEEMDLRGLADDGLPF